MYTSPLTLESLLVLDAIERRGSFAAAAEQLNKVPSALSYIVQKLEEQLGVTIFVKQGRRSVLTPAGLHLLNEGRKVLGAVSKIAEQTQTIAHGWEPKINIAFDSIIDTKILFSGIKTFLNEHGNIEIDLREEVMNGTWEALNMNSVDLVIGAASPIPNHQGIRAVKITQLNNVLVVNKSHELVQYQQPVSSKDIATHRTVIVHDSSKHDIPWSANIIENSKHFYVSSIAQKIEAIIAGIGVGFLPVDRIKPFLASRELVAIETINPVKPIDLHMAWKVVNKGKGLKKLITTLETAFNES